MAQDRSKPAPKLQATRTPSANLTRPGKEHDEAVIDESVDESFPASDPAAIASPGGTQAVKNVAESGRGTPAAEHNTARTRKQPGRK